MRTVLLFYSIILLSHFDGYAQEKQRFAIEHPLGQYKINFDLESRQHLLVPNGDTEDFLSLKQVVNLLMHSKKSGSTQEIEMEILHRNMQFTSQDVSISYDSDNTHLDLPPAHMNLLGPSVGTKFTGQFDDSIPQQLKSVQKHSNDNLEEYFNSLFWVIFQIKSLLSCEELFEGDSCNQEIDILTSIGKFKCQIKVSCAVINDATNATKKWILTLNCKDKKPVINSKMGEVVILEYQDVSIDFSGTLQIDAISKRVESYKYEASIEATPSWSPQESFLVHDKVLYKCCDCVP